MRIAAVQNIQKITKAMQMVAAAKLRKVERLLAGARAFGVSAGSLGLCCLLVLFSLVLLYLDTDNAVMLPFGLPGPVCQDLAHH